MIAQQKNEYISLSVFLVAWVQFPAVAEYFKGFPPSWSHSANPSWASAAENGSISAQCHRATCGLQGGRQKFNHGQTIAEIFNVSWPVSGVCKNWPTQSLIQCSPGCRRLSACTRVPIKEITLWEVLIYLMLGAWSVVKEKVCARIANQTKNSGPRPSTLYTKSLV